MHSTYLSKAQDRDAQTENETQDHTDLQAECWACLAAADALCVLLKTCFMPGVIDTIFDRSKAAIPCCNQPELDLAHGSLCEAGLLEKLRGIYEREDRKHLDE